MERSRASSTYDSGLVKLSFAKKTSSQPGACLVSCDIWGGCLIASRLEHCLERTLPPRLVHFGDSTSKRVKHILPLHLMPICNIRKIAELRYLYVEISRSHSFSVLCPSLSSNVPSSPIWPRPGPTLPSQRHISLSYPIR